VTKPPDDIQLDRPLEFRSADGDLHVRIALAALQRADRSCRLAHPLETGGILAGYYSPNRDCALIERLSRAPLDSRRQRRSFQRGVRQLQTWLELLRKQHGMFYIGEWHYHPGTSVTPSRRDLTEMRVIASSPAYNCPEPLLLILGASVCKPSRISVSIIPAVGERITLTPVEPAR